MNIFGDYQGLATFVRFAIGRIRKTAAVGILLLGLYGMYAFIDNFVPPYAAHLASGQDTLRAQAQTYQLIDIVLRRSLVVGGASRVILFRFHNGSHDISDLKFFFASPTDVVASPGITSDAPANVPASAYGQVLGDGSSVLTHLLNHQPSMIISEDMPNGYLKQVYTNSGVGAVLYIGVYGLNDELIGFLSIAWQDERNVPEKDKMDAFIQTQQIEAASISGYLYHLPPHLPVFVTPPS